MTNDKEYEIYLNRIPYLINTIEDYMVAFTDKKSVEDCAKSIQNNCMDTHSIAGVFANICNLVVRKQPQNIVECLPELSNKFLEISYITKLGGTWAQYGLYLFYIIKFVASECDDKKVQQEINLLLETLRVFGEELLSREQIDELQKMSNQSATCAYSSNSTCNKETRALSLQYLFETRPAHRNDLDELSEEDFKYTNSMQHDDVMPSARTMSMGYLRSYPLEKQKKPKGKRKIVGKTKAQASLSRKSQQVNFRVVDITIWSPVNVRVYTDNKNQELMYIDHNSGFDYAFNKATIKNDVLELIFVSKGFEKKVTINCNGNNCIEYRLGAILSKSEILASYDREESLILLQNNEPTGYVFKTLGMVGLKEDVESIVCWLMQWQIEMVSDSTINYCIALACEAIARLSIKFSIATKVQLIEKIGRLYNAKESYGYIIKGALEKLYTCFPKN